MPCTYGMYSLYARSLRSPPVDFLAGVVCPEVNVFLLFVFYHCVTILCQLLRLSYLRFHTYDMYSLFARSLRSPLVDFLTGGVCDRKSAYFCFLSSTIVTILHQILSSHDFLARGFYGVWLHRTNLITNPYVGYVLYICPVLMVCTHCSTDL